MNSRISTALVDFTAGFNEVTEFGIDNRQLIDRLCNHALYNGRLSSKHECLQFCTAITANCKSEEDIHQVAINLWYKLRDNETTIYDQYVINLILGHYIQSGAYKIIEQAMQNVYLQNLPADEKSNIVNFDIAISLLDSIREVSANNSKKDSFIARAQVRADEKSESIYKRSPKPFWMR